MKLEALAVVVDRFWALVNKDGRQMPGHEGIGNCWEWNGATTTSKAGDEYQAGSKYGTFSLPWEKDADGNKTKRVHVKAHRFSLAISNDGVIPEDMDCCHRCDNTICCRPSHLFWATHQANLADYKAKHGRLFSAKLKTPLRRELLSLEPEDPKRVEA